MLSPRRERESGAAFDAVESTAMAQHFLLSAAARTLSLKTIYAEGEEAAYRRFCGLRWPETRGAPVCPRCAAREAYELAARRRFKCKTCHHQFSVTSGTIFASRKLDFVDLLGAIAVLVNGAKGVSALQLSRCTGLSYKTAFGSCAQDPGSPCARDRRPGYRGDGGDRRRICRRPRPAGECARRSR